MGREPHGQGVGERSTQEVFPSLDSFASVENSLARWTIVAICCYPWLGQDSDNYLDHPLFAQVAKRDYYYINK